MLRTRVWGKRSPPPPLPRPWGVPLTVSWLGSYGGTRPGPCAKGTPPLPPPDSWPTLGCSYEEAGVGGRKVGDREPPCCTDLTQSLQDPRHQQAVRGQGFQQCGSLPSPPPPPHLSLLTMTAIRYSTGLLGSSFHWLSTAWTQPSLAQPPPKQEPTSLGGEGCLHGREAVSPSPTPPHPTAQGGDSAFFCLLSVKQTSTS